MLAGRCPPGRRRSRPGRPPRTPASRSTPSGRWPCWTGPTSTEDDLRCPEDLPAGRGDPAGAAPGGPRQAPDLHELLGQAHRHAAGLRGSGLEPAATIRTRRTRCSWRPASVVERPVRRAGRGHRCRRLRGAGVRAQPGRAGAGVRPGRSGPARQLRRPGRRRDAGIPADGRRHRPGGHPADDGAPRTAGQGRGRGSAHRSRCRTAGRSP